MGRSVNSAGGKRGSVRLPLGAVVLFASIRARGAPAAEVPARISEIVIVREDVFSDAEGDRAFLPYGLANALHAVTREEFIRRELLLSPGDPLDPAALAEAERRLRATKLFREVSVRSEGTTVFVRTGDSWTLIPRLALSNKGGSVTYALGLEDQNFLGTGRYFSFRYEQETDRLSRSLTWVEPQLFGSRWTMTASAADLSDGQDVQFTLARPFDGLLTTGSGLLSYRQSTYDTRLYAGGEETAVWGKHELHLDGEWGRLVRARGEHADRLVALASWENVELGEGSEGGPSPPPGERRFLWLGAGVQREARDWIVRQDHEILGRDEDFNLAPVGRLDFAWSPPVLGAESAGRVRLSGSAGTLVGKGFALAAVSAETRLGADTRNALARAFVRGWWPAGRFLVATRVGVRSSWDPDPESQLYLDGLTGVRGYRLHAVSGTGNATANVEVRTTVIPDLFQIAILGVAAFADAGVSWGPPDGSYRLGDVGVGLRLGLPRAGKNVLVRIDVAHPIHPDPLGRSGWLVSFSSGQAF